MERIPGGEKEKNGERKRRNTKEREGENRTTSKERRKEVEMSIKQQESVLGRGWVSDLQGESALR